MKRDLPPDAGKHHEGGQSLSGREIGIDLDRVARRFVARDTARPSSDRFFLPLTPFCRRDDAEILHSANDTLLSMTEVPTDYVSVRVSNGWITLSGAVDWRWQREIVVNAMRRVVGVAGVGDGIEVRADTSDEAPQALRLVPESVVSQIEA